MRRDDCCETPSCGMPEYRDGLCYDCAKSAYAKRKGLEISAVLKQAGGEAKKNAESRRKYNKLAGQVNAADQGRHRERPPRKRRPKVTPTTPSITPAAPKPVAETAPSKPEASETIATIGAPAECTVERCLYPTVRDTLCGACLSAYNVWRKSQIAGTNRIEPSPEQLKRFQELAGE